MLMYFPVLPTFAASEKACRGYADRAVEQYQITTRKPPSNKQCPVSMSPRWQPYYKNHYEWCLNAQDAWLHSENKARDDHLYKYCGQKDL
jgi:hypothetical protein